MLVQNVSWLPVCLCNILHREEEEAQGGEVDDRKVGSERTYLKYTVQ
jgi:hypothetical protein